MLADLDAAIAAVEQIIAQTRLRISGVTPASAARRVSLHDSVARPIRKGGLAKPTQFGCTGQVPDDGPGSCWTRNSNLACQPTSHGSPRHQTGHLRGKRS